MDEKKRSTIEALNRYYKKQIKSKKPSRKNKKPEKEVERQCVTWMRAQGWDVQILEAKGRYSSAAGRYVPNTSVSAGTCDLVGVLPDGIFIAIEFKSPGNLASFNRPHNLRQRLYIQEKIKMNAFACVVDSLKRLQSIYETWVKSPEEQRKAYLFATLP